LDLSSSDCSDRSLDHTLPCSAHGSGFSRAARTSSTKLTGIVNDLHAQA